jgi:hypothetical protein
VQDLQVRPTRALATVSDAPLDKKVEMTNWEKVHEIPQLPYHPRVLPGEGMHCPTVWHLADIDPGQLH